jgi:hypothetical protein
MKRRNKKYGEKEQQERQQKISQLSNKTTSSEWSSRGVFLLHRFLIIFK